MLQPILGERLHQAITIILTDKLANNHFQQEQQMNTL